MLKAESISRSFGDLTAVYNLSFILNGGEILSVIGPNGSGKTTLFNLITGFLRAEKGKLDFLCQGILTRISMLKVEDISPTSLYSPTTFLTHKSKVPYAPPHWKQGLITYPRHRQVQGDHK